MLGCGNKGFVDGGKDGSRAIAGRRDMSVGGAGGGDEMDWANSSKWCGKGWCIWLMRMLARSAMVSVAVEKMGGLLVHPMGRTSGKAMSGSAPGGVGKTTPSFGMSSMPRAIR